MSMREKAQELLHDPLERVEEIADHWQCSKQHVRDLIKAKKLKAVFLSERIIRVRRSERLRYEAEREKESAK